VKIVARTQNPRSLLSGQKESTQMLRGKISHSNLHSFEWHSTQEIWADWIEQCFTSPPTQYRLYGRRFLQVKKPNQQCQSIGGTYSTQTK